MECYTDCNKAFFPDIECRRSSIQFKYAGNRYNKFYEFRRPDLRLGETGADNYEKCKGKWYKYRAKEDNGFCKSCVKIEN